LEPDDSGRPLIAEPSGLCVNRCLLLAQSVDLSILRDRNPLHDVVQHWKRRLGWRDFASFMDRACEHSGGRYVLFHDFTPDSVGMQVVPVELAVEGAERPPVTLVADDDRTQSVDGYDVALAHSPLRPGADCTMTFTLMRRGKPVTDLEPFLGAMGHLVMISQDRASFVHSHPLEARQVIGPSVEFNVRFDRTGLYKAWGQFQRHGRVNTVPFVLRVFTDGRGGNDGTGAASLQP